jgi:alpha-ribazole phosphatase
MDGLSVWRHPKPGGVQGRCIGRTDVVVDRRKSKRLAHRIRAWARRHDAPRVVVTSPLRRGADVGRWLAAWGWSHRIDARLTELDFGTWDGCAWAKIGAQAVDAWCADFVNHRPGAGEPLAALLARCASFMDEQREDASVCVVGHAGWISAARWWQRGGEAPPLAATWPVAVGYGMRVTLTRVEQVAEATMR